jgi:hypothetical protein
VRAVGRVTRSAAARALGWQEDERPYSDFCLILGMPTRRCAALTCRSRNPSRCCGDPSTASRHS